MNQQKYAQFYNLTGLLQNVSYPFVSFVSVGIKILLIRLFSFFFVLLRIKKRPMK